MSSSMSVSKVVWAAGFIGFAALNVWAIAVGGLSGFVDYLTTLGPFGVLATVDLLIALLIGMVFVVRNAGARSIDARPYLILTLVTGSLGLLGYLARRGIGPGATDATDG